MPNDKDNPTENNDMNEIPEERANGEGPMLDSQKVILEDLANKTGTPNPDEHLSESKASEKIKELREEAEQNDETFVDDLDEP